MAAAALFIYPLDNAENSSYQRSVCQRRKDNLITEDKIKKTAEESSEAGTAKNDKWLKTLYKIMKIRR